MTLWSVLFEPLGVCWFEFLDSFFFIVVVNVENEKERERASVKRSWFSVRSSIIVAHFLSRSLSAPLSLSFVLWRKLDWIPHRFANSYKNYFSSCGNESEKKFARKKVFSVWIFFWNFCSFPCKKSSTDIIDDDTMALHIFRHFAPVLSSKMLHCATAVECERFFIDSMGNLLSTEVEPTNLFDNFSL